MPPARPPSLVRRVHFAHCLIFFAEIRVDLQFNFSSIFWLAKSAVFRYNEKWFGQGVILFSYFALACWSSFSRPRKGGKRSQLQRDRELNASKTGVVCAEIEKRCSVFQRHRFRDFVTIIVTSFIYKNLDQFKFDYILIPKERLISYVDTTVFNRSEKKSDTMNRYLCR